MNSTIKYLGLICIGIFISCQSSDSKTDTKTNISSAEDKVEAKLDDFMKMLHQKCNVEKIGYNMPVRIFTNSKGEMVEYQVMMNSGLMDKKCFDKWAVKTQRNFKALRTEFNNKEIPKTRYEMHTRYLNK